MSDDIPGISAGDLERLVASRDTEIAALRAEVAQVKRERDEARARLAAHPVSCAAAAEVAEKDLSRWIVRCDEIQKDVSALRVKYLTVENRAEAAEARVAELEAGLTFDLLRRVNVQRNESAFHGEGWSLCDWMTALAGEVGEAANIIKKVRRGDRSLDEARTDLARELADVQTYLDLLAHYAGIDLGAATVEKWDTVSERIGSPLRLRALLAPPAETPAPCATCGGAKVVQRCPDDGCCEKPCPKCGGGS